MKAISVHLPEGTYQELKSMAARSGRPMAELIRQAMAEYLDRQRQGRSILAIPPHRGGKQLRGWTRSEIADEMSRR